LPPIISGTTAWTQLFSEPDAGSDLAVLRTVAKRVEGGWRIQGQKIWSTYAHIADWGFLLARSEPNEERHRGISAFLVPMATEGVVINPLREITGDSDFNEVFFDDVFLEEDSLLGVAGHGWQIAMDLLAEERSVTGRNVIGLRSELDRLSSLSTADESLRILAESRLGQLCATSSAIMSTVAAARPGLEPLAKVLFSELNIEVHQFALDVLAHGMSAPEGWRARWADNYWNTRALTISGGANEVLRNVVAKRTLGIGPGSDSAPLPALETSEETLERTALKGLFETHNETDHSWSALVENGWLDLLPEPRGRWEFVGAAVSVAKIVAEEERRIGFVGHLGANAVLADIGLEHTHESLVATEAVVTDHGVRATAWGPLDNVSEFVLGPLNGALYRADSDDAQFGDSISFDREHALARQITLPLSSLRMISGDSLLIERHTRRLAILLAADALGSAERSFKRTRQYISERQQFGTKLASNQALQHRLFDMFAAVSVLRDLLDAAAEGFDGTSGEHLAWSAKSVAGDRATWVVEQAIQLHGGNGFTWEFGLHWSLGRAQRARLLLGGPTESYANAARTYRCRPRPMPTDWSKL
jgi:alkylation response protein AidB-like acyl-CoA dehydrogenase